MRKRDGGTLRRRSERRKVGFSPGDVFKIPLPGGLLAFGRVLEHGEYAFYGGGFVDIPPIEDIVGLPVVFRIWVMDRAIASGRWPLIGARPLDSVLSTPSEFFMQDPITNALFIYDPRQPKPATLGQCADLECAAAWDPEHVEERLEDLLAGRVNKWVEAMKAKPPD